MRRGIQEEGGEAATPEEVPGWSCREVPSTGIGRRLHRPERRWRRVSGKKKSRVKNVFVKKTAAVAVSYFGSNWSNADIGEFFSSFICSTRRKRKLRKLENGDSALIVVSDDEEEDEVVEVEPTKESQEIIVIDQEEEEEVLIV